MDKYKENKKKRDAVLTSRVKKTAEITGVSNRYVRMVINGEYRNEDVLSTYMFIQEGENKLLREAKLLVPFN
jgi:hypothetical protein